MGKTKRIAIIALAALLFVACFIGGGILLRSFYRRALRASADDGVTEINLADYFTFHWTLLPYGTELGDETVYRYRYLSDGEWHEYFTTTPLSAAPDPAWTAWKQVSAVSAVRSVALYRSDGFTPHVEAEFSAALPADCYSVSYEGDRSVSGTGEYLTKAVLTLTNPSYRFVYEPQGVELSGRGMSVVIRADGTATVSKTWYVAYSQNALLSQDSAGEPTEYTFSSWTFGQFGGQKAPRLKRGDELFGEVRQPDGYALWHDGFKIAEITDGQTEYYDEDYENGTKDLLTFTLRREGEVICENESRSKWSYYLNDYTPAGNYSVTFTAQPLTVSSHTSWWNAEENFITGENGTEFRGFTAVYEFEVFLGSFALQDGTLNQYGKTDAEPYAVPLNSFRFGNYSEFFAPATQKITFSGQIGRAEALISGTFWGVPEVAEQYFDALPRLSFRLSGASDGEYRAASADWSNALNAPAVYTVYYRAEMRNYSATPVGEEERYRHYFRVNVFLENATADLSATLRDESGNEIGVFVEGAQGNASLEAQFVPLTADGFGEKKLALEKAGLEARAAFEVALKVGDEPVSPAGTVRVGISVPAALKGAEGLQLVLVDGKGEIRIFPCTEEDGKFLFGTDELGTVCFVTPRETDVAAEPRDNTGLIAAVCVLGAVAAAQAVVFAVLGIKKRRKNDAGKQD